MITQEEAKTIDEFEKWPEIGSREGAVRSCVSLLSAVCGQPVEVMDRWLDLYYQVRHDKEKADAAARAAEIYGISPDKDRFVEASLKASAEKITKRLREELKIPEIAGPMRAASQECRTLPARQDAPTAKDEAAPEPPPQKEAEKTAPSQSAAPTALPGGASQENAEDGEAKAEPEVLRENRIKRPGGKGTPRPSQIGNTRIRDAAVFKRQVRDRLEAVRKKGVSAPELVKAAPAGSVKEPDIYMILQGHVVKIGIYRALDEALRHFEN